MRQPSPAGLSHFATNNEESLSAGNLEMEVGRSKSIARESFKCSVACFHLPGFHKRKSMLPLPGSAQHSPESTVVSGMTRGSTALSLERFKCSSSSSGTVFNFTSEEEGWASPYYDLPVELIRRSIDAESPVNAAFVFEPKRNMKAKRPSSLPQSKSVYVNKSHNYKLEWAPSSCPASPPAGPRNSHKLSKAEQSLVSFMN